MAHWETISSIQIVQKYVTLNRGFWKTSSISILHALFIVRPMRHPDKRLAQGFVDLVCLIALANFAMQQWNKTICGDVVHHCLPVSWRLYWSSSPLASLYGTNAMLTLNSHAFVFSFNTSETICQQVLPKSCCGVWSDGYGHVGSLNENGIFGCCIFQFLFRCKFVVISGPSLNIWKWRIENSAELKFKSESIFSLMSLRRWFWLAASNSSRTWFNKNIASSGGYDWLQLLHGRYSSHPRIWGGICAHKGGGRGRRKEKERRKGFLEWNSMPDMGSHWVLKCWWRIF